MFQSDTDSQHIVFRKESEILSKRIQGLSEGYRQNIALLGLRGMGKTSLVRSCLAHASEAGCIPVYLELVHGEDFRQLARRWTATLLHQAVKDHVPSPDRSLDSLLRIADELTPSLALSVKRLLAKSTRVKASSEIFTEFLSLTSSLREVTQKPCVFVLEEFHNLESLGIRNAFSVLSSHIMIQKHTMFLLTSSHVQRAKHLLAEKLTLLFGNFEILEMAALGAEDSCHFLEQRVGSTRISPLVKEYLSEVSGGHPYYLDILGQKLAALNAPEPWEEVTREYVVEALFQLLFQPTGVLNQHFTLMLECVAQTSRKRRAAAVLLALSEGPQRSDHVAKTIGLSRKSVTSELARLQDADLVLRRSTLYSLTDGVFALWLDTAYRCREMLFPHSLVAAATAFRQRAAEAIETFGAELPENQTEQIINLFESFGNEVVEVDCRSRRLQRFQEVRSTHVEGLGRIIRAQSPLANWVCLFLEKEPSDRDVWAFSRWCQESRQKIHRRIIATSNKIDNTSRLIAKELHIWAWDLDQINQLLETYGKPKIMRKNGSENGNAH
ncbi:MAG: AAA family ATPase [Candidatus Omnitrophica bacterium]|nr:AAA family ATPase [Candidatus Omnitrophota bacterium]